MKMRQRSLDVPPRMITKFQFAIFCLLVPLALLVPVIFVLNSRHRYTFVASWTMDTVASSRNHTLAANDENYLKDALLLLSEWREEKAKNARKIANLCPLWSPYLRGRIEPDNSTKSWQAVDNHVKNMSHGGKYHVRECHSRHYVAIVIPYRNRDAHLRAYLYNMLPIFIRQQLDFGIYVIEQLPGSDFNRGMLMNIGYVEALKEHHYSCFIFTDVDLILEDDRTSYGCRSTPTHLSVAIDTHGYKLRYDDIFGGVVSFRTDHFQLINGFSNQYFKWGGEDDDIRVRTVKRNLTIKRPPMKFARYKMLGHKKQEKNPERFDFLKKAATRIDLEGLNSLEYTVVRKRRNHLFTKISVHINQSAIVTNLSYYDKLYFDKITSSNLLTILDDNV